MLKLRMSLPPTANHRLLPVKAGKGVRMVKAPKYREWMESAAMFVREQALDALELDKAVANTHSQPLFAQEVTALTVVYFPDRRRSDLDNVLKGVNDALVKARVIADDSLITTQIAQRGANIPRGMVEVYIWPEDSADAAELSSVLSKLTYGKA